MSKKNTRNALDTSLSYAVIGLDLAKADCAVAAVPCSDDELGLIDRMDYESLFEQAEKLKPTLFAMEPCCGYSQISLRLQNMGHEVKVISGHAVKNWIATHKSNQKTDLNDATALAKLALYDHDLQPIRVKNVEEWCPGDPNPTADTGYKILSLLQKSVPMLGHCDSSRQLEHKEDGGSSRSR